MPESPNYPCAHAGGVSEHIHPMQAIPMVIRVKDDATRLYAEDQRWEHLAIVS